MSNKIIHNNHNTVLTGMTSEQLKAFFDQHPYVYYQNYVAGSISPYYTKDLAYIGASEESYEFLNAYFSNNKEELISEAGDLLFQLNNIANFENINVSDLKLTPKNNNINNFITVFGELLGTHMKSARYPDPTYFETKYGMTLEQRLSEKLSTVLVAFMSIIAKFNLTMMDIMTYNLHKLDERHSSNGVYEFGSGYANTRADGGNANR